MPQAKTLTPAELERVLTYIDSKPIWLRHTSHTHGRWRVLRWLCLLSGGAKSRLPT